MTLYKKQTKTSASEALKGALAADYADKNNPYLVESDLSVFELPYKSFVFYLLQNGTSAPTYITLSNNLGYFPEFSYATDGTYAIDFPAEALNKIFVVEGNRSFYVDNTNVIDVSLNIVSTTVDIVSRYNGVPANNVIGQVSANYCVEIRVYE